MTSQADKARQLLRLGIEVGLAGGSVEDFTGRDDDPVYGLQVAFG